MNFMRTENSTTRKEYVGTINLYTPNDWFDLLADGDDTEAARRTCASLIDRSYPNRDQTFRQELIESLLTWRTILLGEGAVMHGLVTWPGDNSENAVWQLTAGVIRIPHVDGDLDLMEVMARKFGHDISEGNSHVESFETDMGSGLGIISQPEMGDDGHLALFPESDVAEDSGSAAGLSGSRIGFALAVTCPPGGGYGLLIIGNSMDPDQTAMMAGLVGIIAARSTFIDLHEREISTEGSTEE